MVAAELKRYNIDIAALSETRLLGEGSLKEEGEGYTFFWRGYPAGGQHLHGVGLAIKNSILPNLTETPVGISERLMSLRFPLAGKEYATIFSAYAPTLPSEKEVRHLMRLLGKFNDMIQSCCWVISMQEWEEIVISGME